MGIRIGKMNEWMNELSFSLRIKKTRFLFTGQIKSSKNDHEKRTNASVKKRKEN